RPGGDQERARPGRRRPALAGAGGLVARAPLLRAGGVGDEPLRRPRLADVGVRPRRGRSAGLPAQRVRPGHAVPDQPAQRRGAVPLVLPGAGPVEPLSFEIEQLTVLAKESRAAEFGFRGDAPEGARRQAEAWMQIQLAAEEPG